MKRKYEKMEAYGVTFNAKEQIAAQACLMYETSTKYKFNGTDYCMINTKYTDIISNPCQLAESTLVQNLQYQF